MPLGKDIVLEPEATATTFGARIRQLRKASGLTQRDLAERVSGHLRKDDGRGFDFTYLSKIEKEKQPPPSTPAIRQLAGAADLAHARSAIIELGALSRFERPLPVMTDYDGLLGQEVAP